MSDIPGMKRPELPDMPQMEDRITFLYLEHCEISREDSALTARSADGTVSVPSASLSVLILGPGTSVTHRAVELAGDSGVTVIWAGENGVRYYASGRGLTSRARLLEKQAKAFSNQRTHLAVVRRMYSLRFPDEDTEGLTLQQLRGREGSRVRGIYRESSKKWDVPWNGRTYEPGDIAAGDAVNQALTVGHSCLYGLAHAVIAGLGCSPGLGFVHIGHALSFVYDVADLYKAEITIPLAFEVAAEYRGQDAGAVSDDISAVMRRRTRDVMFSFHLIERMVRDIHMLFDDKVGGEAEEPPETVILLWDNLKSVVQGSRSW